MCRQNGVKLKLFEVIWFLGSESADLLRELEVRVIFDNLGLRNFPVFNYFIVRARRHYVQTRFIENLAVFSMRTQVSNDFIQS